MEKVPDVEFLQRQETDFLNDLEETKSSFLNLKSFSDSLQQIRDLHKNEVIREKLKAYQELVQEENFKKSALIKNMKSNKAEDDHESLDDVLKKQKSIDEEADILKREVQLKENYLIKLKAQISDLQESKRKDIDTKLEKELDTYRFFFPVKFDTSAPETTTKGFVLQESNSNVIPFSFNSETRSQFFITNYLWKQFGDPKQFENDK